MTQILPRTRDPIYVPPKKKKTKVRWTFPISLFVKWRPDDAELINLCFEYDWDCGKIPKIVKDEGQV
jgi:NLR family CARD domain-containing protein 3